MWGLSRGGEQVSKCKVAYLAAMEDLIKLASLQVGRVGVLRVAGR